MNRATAALPLMLLATAVAGAQPRATTAIVKPELRLDYVRRSLTVTVRHYTQYLDGLPVIGTERVETDRGGTTRVVFERLARSAGEPRVLVAAVPSGQGTMARVNVEGEARPAWRRVVEERPLEPVVRYFDDETGALLREDRLYYTARVRVFDVNPVAKLNDPSLHDQNDIATAVPDAAYSFAELDDLTASTPLTGPDVRIVDLEAPFTPHADAATPLDLLDRSHPEFEEVNAYFQLTRAQKYLRSLGYTGDRQLVAYSLPVDAHAANGTDNSYFIEGSTEGEGTLFFGDGGTDDAEDSDIVLHEFAHAIHTWIAPGTLSGSVESQARALSEGFADYWSFSSTYEGSVVSGRDPFCIADWDARCAGDDPAQNCGYAAGSDCLRRVDGAKTMSDYVLSQDSGTEYGNSAIWSSAMREIFMLLTVRHGVAEGKRISDTLALESMFGIPPSPSFRDVALRMSEADADWRGGADLDVICGAMTSRGIFGAGECGVVPRGEWTMFPSAARDLPIPDGGGEVTSSITIDETRAIDAIAVRVDLRHPNRGDLEITLIAPDGTRIPLKRSSSIDRTDDVHATFGLDANPASPLDVLRGRSAAGTWSLAVRDVFSGDAGILQSWGLVIRLAGDEPSPTRLHRSLSRVAPAGHVTGEGGRTWTTDLRLFNRGIRSGTVVVTFTPSDGDGTTAFASMQIETPPSAVVRLDDVVSQLLSRGTGSLEIASSSADILATTRSHFVDAGGTFGDAFAPLAGGGVREFLPRLSNDAATRSNVGWIETAGAAGRVRLRVIDGRTGVELETREEAVLPYSHHQVGVTANGTLLVAEMDVVAGDARIVGFGSTIDRTSGDSVVIAAEEATSAPRVILAPAIRSTGLLGATWTSVIDVAAVTGPGAAVRTFVDNGTGVIASDTLPFLVPISADESAAGPAFTFGTVVLELPPGQTAASRVVNGHVAGNVSFFSIGDAPVASDVIGIEVSSVFRANGGAINPAETPATVTLSAFDGGGGLLDRVELVVPGRSTVQIPLPAGTARLTVGPGVFAYASVIDNRSGDAWFLPGR